MPNAPENTTSNGGRERNYRQQLRTILSQEKETSARQIQQMLRLGAEWFDVDLGLLVQIDQSTDTYRIDEVSTPTPDITQGLTGDLLFTYCRMVVAEEEPLAVENASKQDGRDGSAYSSSLLGTYIGTTVKLDGDVYGTICFVDLEPQDTPFEEHDRTFLDRLAQGIGRILDQQRTVPDPEPSREMPQNLSVVERRYRTALKHSPVIFAKVDEDLRYEWIYNPHEDFDPDSVVGKRDDELDSGPGVDHLMTLKRRTIEEGEQNREEILFDRSDGLHVYDVTATPLREGPDDAVTGVITAALNISEQKRREQLLRSRERKTEMLYKVTGQLLTTSDREEVFSQIHSVLQQIFDYTLCAVGFEKDGQLFPAQATRNEAYQTPPERPHDLESGSISARAYRSNETVVVKDIETLDNEIEYGDIRSAIGIPIAGHGVITVGKAQVGEFDSFDLRLLEVLAAHASVVLDRLDREDALIEAKEEAEAAARFKSSMMANMSHEIRTPLTSIIGFAELLADNLEGELGTFAEKAHKSGNRLMKTLNSVLELSRLESDSYDLPEEQVALSPIVKQTTDRLRPQAKHSNLDVETVLPDDTVEGTFNEEAVRRILENLLENAIKFTPAQGTITVRLHANEDEAILEVEDTGIGISDETLPEIFEAFRQESEGLNREYEGSGLGLPIVRELTEALEGDLGVETEKNEGSRFVVRLPRTRDDSA